MYVFVLGQAGPQVDHTCNFVGSCLSFHGLAFSAFLTMAHSRQESRDWGTALANSDVRLSAVFRGSGIEDWPDLAALTDVVFREEVLAVCDHDLRLQLDLLREESMAVLDCTLTKRAKMAPVEGILPGTGTDKQKPVGEAKKQTKY